MYSKGCLATGWDAGQALLHKGESNGGAYPGGTFALRTHCALLLDYVPPEEPPSRPLGNALRIK